MRIATITAFWMAAAGLAGCGNSLEEQAASGALGGAVVGGAVADAPLAGAAAGGLLGTGAEAID